jgi:elongation factor Ts
MTAITAALVKELRERTGAAMMDCKKALDKSQGNIDQAIEELRKSGQAKADKKAGRVAAEGAIGSAEAGGQAVIVEVNSETDFVARAQHFTAYVKAVAETALKSQITNVPDLSQHILTGDQLTVEAARQALIAKVGENVQIRRIAISNPRAATVGLYLHGCKIGVMVELDVVNQELARDIAMHIAASKPMVIFPEEVDSETVAKEKEIYLAQSVSSGKPQEIVEKMVMGRLKKFLDEVSLVGQTFIKDPDITVGNLLNKHRAQVLAFYRFQVGEGIEKPASQVQGK